ncbi:methyltransferase [Pseudomonas sp. MWU15-20650]|uniref:methyltransferase n=1 Tax=Pseudomonas sp. MWU15-20650 TaxID=2933107 RepID=UPI00200CC51D|nr:methyltransferase [Pseudomonas sp. MWU15-20650]
MLNQGTIDFRGKLPSSEALVHTLVNGYMLSASLFGCVEVGLFSHLDETSGMTISEVADACQLSATQVQKLVSFGLSVGLIIQRDEQFFNSSDAQKLLSRHSAHNICSAVEHHSRHVYPLFGQLAESLKSGKPISDRLQLSSAPGNTNEFYAELDKSENDFDVFMSAMNTFSTGAGTRIADAVSARIGSAAPLRILDLGGGGGQVSIEIAQAIPLAQITLIDLEKATRFARAEVDRNGLGDRISCLSGDIFARLPLAEAEFDVVLISAVLGDWSHDYQVTLLANAHHHLKSGGCLVVSETLLDDDLAGPILPALMSLYVQILTEGGQNFTARSLVALLSGNRFDHIEVQLNRVHGCRDTVLASKISEGLRR